MSNRIRTAAVASSVTAVVMLCLFALFWRFSQSAAEKTFSGKLSAIQAIIDENSIYDFDVAAAESNAAYGYLSGLNDDKYFMYYSQSEFEESVNSMNGDGSGIGIIMSYNPSGIMSDGILVRRVIGGSPAEAAGVKAGDRIMAMNGKDITVLQFSDISDELVFAAGDVVELSLLQDGQTIVMSLTAAKYTEREIDYYKTDEGFGYVRIHRFATNAAEQFRAAMEALNEQDVCGYIFDVRGNGGGELETVCKMVDMLVSEGDIIIMQSKTGEEIRRATPDKLLSVPCVVLVDGQTASAAEMFASALRDLISAPLIGAQTYGKAVGQTMFELPDSSAVKITTFRYLTSGRVNFNDVGLVPDVIEEFDQDKLTRLYYLSAQEDTQLLLAAEQLKSKIG